MRYAKFAVISALVVFLTLGFISGPSVVVAVRLAPVPAPTVPVNNPNAKKKLTENQALCDGNQLKASLRNPTCRGWWLTSITDPAERPFYLSSFSNACTVGTDGNLQCFFRTGMEACKAWADARNADPNLSSDFKKVCGCGEHAKNAGQTNYALYNCAWCGKKEMGCSGNGNQFFSTLKCNGNKHDIANELVPTGAYHSYCNLPVEGPYSEIPDQYTVCGSTINETYPGMVFTEDQRRQIRQINRNQYGITERYKLRSDLAGFCYPKPNKQECIKNHPTKPDYCVEPGTDPDDPLLTSWPTNKPESGQIHHVIPKSDARNLRCPCGRNSMKNAVIISAQLNRYFSNRDRTTFKSDCDSGMNELEKVNSLPKYSQLSARKAASANSPSKKARKIKSYRP